MEIDYTSESIRILKEELDKFINDLFNEEYNIKINLIKERVELIEEDCVFLKNIYSTYLSYNMFYIYCCAYDLIYTDPTLFNNMEKIQKLIENMEFKFGYDSTKYKLDDIINHIKLTYIECDKNEYNLHKLLRAKYPFYTTNISVFFELYVQIIEFATLYIKLYLYDNNKSKLFLKKILDLNIYNNVKNLEYDISLINSICIFINIKYKDDFTKLLLNLDIFINYFDLIQSFSMYDKDLIFYFNKTNKTIIPSNIIPSNIIPNDVLREKIKSIYSSVIKIPIIIFLYKILEYDNEEMIFPIFEILNLKKHILDYDISILKLIFNISTPPEYNHLYNNLIYYYDKYYYNKIYENYHYQNKYLKYKLKYLEKKNIK